MLVKLNNPKIFSDAISIISELVTEVRIKVDKQGLSIVAIDPANVALVAFNIPAVAFSTFEANEETIGLSLDNLKSVLRRASAGSNLVMQTEDNMLKIEIHDKIKRTFSLALINIETEEKAVPSLEFSSKVEMNSSDFQEAIEDCSVVADSSTFMLKEGKFIIEAKGLNSAKNEFSSDEVKIEGTDGKSKYSLEYLQKFTKACKIAERMRINFAEDYPLRLEFSNPLIALVFILAPRVENDN